jgi:hypothetical protein
MRLLRTVVVENPLGAVFDYLSDFTTTTQWDPGTVTTVRQHGNGGIGTTYLKHLDISRPEDATHLRRR